MLPRDLCQLDSAGAALLLLRHGEASVDGEALPSHGVRRVRREKDARLGEIVDRRRLPQRRARRDGP